jgi:hypothetical protein
MTRRNEEILRDQGWFRWKKLLKMAKNINNIKVPAKTMIGLSSHSQEMSFCYVIFHTFCYAWLILLYSISVMVKYQKTYFWIAKVVFYLDFYLLVLNLVLIQNCFAFYKLLIHKGFIEMSMGAEKSWSPSLG